MPHILIVDDDDAFRESLAETLGDLGHTVIEASGGRQALECFASGVLIDCAWLDYVSSAGLRVFLIATRAAKRGGIAFAVCGLRPAVREVFEISGFGQLMAVHSDRSLALARMPS